MEMNSTLEEVSACLYAGRVPLCWSKLSPQTVKSLARYVDHIAKRTLQYLNWVNKHDLLGSEFVKCVS